MLLPLDVWLLQRRLQLQLLIIIIVVVVVLLDDETAGAVAEEVVLDERWDDGGEVLMELGLRWSVVGEDEREDALDVFEDRARAGPGAAVAGGGRRGDDERRSPLLLLRGLGRAMGQPEGLPALREKPQITYWVGQVPPPMAPALEDASPR